ncbi:MAG: hypothetical protein K6E54_09415 [Bacteroidaceae bacterium]|nr:hypothetical protein [Bacteroidaceae bacterium]
MGIWYGVDPLTEKYTEISGYVYCHANPIILFDSDGRTDYNITSDGHFYERESTFSKFNNVVNWIKKQMGYKVSGTQDRVFKEGNETPLISMPEGTLQGISNYKIKDDEGKTYNCTTFEIKNDKYAAQVFKVLINNTDVEWSRVKHSKGRQSSNTIGTSRDAQTEVSATQKINSYIQRGEQINLFDHSHPWTREMACSPQSAMLNLEISDEDRDFANSHAKYFKNTTLRVFNMKERTIEIYKPNSTGKESYPMKNYGY